MNYLKELSKIGKTTVLIRSPITLGYFLCAVVVAGIFFHDGIQLADLYYWVVRKYFTCNVVWLTTKRGRKLGSAIQYTI